MKNRFFTSIFLIVLAIASLTSCERDTVTMNLSIFDPRSNDAKTALDGLKVKWVNGDAIKINNQSYTISVAGGNATISGIESDDNGYYAFYPAEFAQSAVTNNFQVMMPETYTYTSDGVVCPLAGYSADGQTMVMKTICSLLAITLNDDVTVNSITVTATKGGQPVGLSGNSRLQIVSASEMHLTSGTNNKVTLNFGQPVNVNGEKTFYIPVPEIPSGTVLSFAINARPSGTPTVYTQTKTTTQALSTGSIAHVGFNVLSMSHHVDASLEGTTVSAFTVSSTGKRVYFSTGNLQCRVVDITTSVLNPEEGYSYRHEWRIAPNQYDYCGESNNSKGTYNSWFDLFGWGATMDGSINVAEGVACANIKDPVKYFHGEITGSTNVHNWGIKILTEGNPWRVMTSDEWQYVVNRPGKAAAAKVNGVKGVILLPDGAWEAPAGVTFSTSNKLNYDNNVYTTAQWSLLDQSGAIFLPTTGRMSGTLVSDGGTLNYTVGNPDAQYWTSSKLSDVTSTIVCLVLNGQIITTASGSHFVGNAVRLVKDAD